MPPNPRDGHRLVEGVVPLDGVRAVVADAMAVALPGEPVRREQLAALIVDRLARYRLLAADVGDRSVPFTGISVHIEGTLPAVNLSPTALVGATKYALHAGTVTSQHDGDSHFVTAPELARLYKLERGEWVEWRQGFPEADYVHLWPRRDGKYGRPTPWVPAPTMAQALAEYEERNPLQLGPHPDQGRHDARCACGSSSTCAVGR